MNRGMNIELNTYLVSNPIYHLVALVAARGVPIDHRMPGNIRHAGADQVCRICDAHEAVARVLLCHDTEARRARIKVRAVQAFLNIHIKEKKTVSTHRYHATVKTEHARSVSPRSSSRIYRRPHYARSFSHSAAPGAGAPSPCSLTGARP